jgi:predicted transcriptional regulator
MSYEWGHDGDTDHPARRQLEKALSRIAKSTGRTKSDIAREALERQVAVARFRELRRKTLPLAEAQGLISDEDVFAAIS